MKRIIIIGFMSVMPLAFLNAQHMTNNWIKNVGGSKQEVNFAGGIMNEKALVEVDTEGDVIVVVASNSSDGMITDPKGSVDCFITKYTDNGEVIWSKSFGGSGYEIPRKLITLANGDFVIAGYTNSNDGDLTGHNGGSSALDPDGFIARFDKDGSVLWAKQYGGDIFEPLNFGGQDKLFSCLENKKGNIVAVGESNTQYGDFEPNWTATQTFYVGWFLEVNGQTGAIEKIKRVVTVNGTQSGDRIEDIFELSDGTGYFVLGNLTSGLANGYWCAKLDTNGGMLWEKEFGSPTGGLVAQAAVVETYDNQAMIAVTTPNTETVNYNGGDTDAWLLKVDMAKGDIIDQNCFGGTSSDVAVDLLKDGTGKYYLCGGTKSRDGYMHGGEEGAAMRNYIINFTEDFDTTWSYTFGGSGVDIATQLAVNSEGELFVAGITHSSDGFYSTSYGESDAWVGKFTNDLTGVSVKKKTAALDVYPNPASTVLNIKLPTNDNAKIYSVSVMDVLGRRLDVEKTFKQNDMKLNVDNYDNGVYFLEIKSRDKSYITKFVVKH